MRSQYHPSIVVPKKDSQSSWAAGTSPNYSPLMLKETDTGSSVERKESGTRIASHTDFHKEAERMREDCDCETLELNDQLF